MEASTSSTAKSTPADGKELVAAKIQEGITKVHAIGRLADEADRDIDVLEKQVDDMEATMELELLLDEYCCDLSDMRKARHVYGAVSLSEAERRSLSEIHDLAASAIDDYVALVGPVPSHDNHVSLFSETIPLEFPGPLDKAFPRSSASHSN